MPLRTLANAWRAAWSTLQPADSIAPWGNNWIAPTFLSLVLIAAAPTHFLLFHSLAELFAIGVAVTVFAVAWNTFAFTRSSFLLYLGCGYLWVAGFDLVHTLTYQGMGVFAIRGANVATQFWIAGRLFEALLFLTAPFALQRRVDPRAVLAAGGLTFAAVCALIFAGYFPTAYVEGQGLTPFKVAAEYVVIALMLASVVLLRQRRERMDPAVNQLVAISIVLTILAELAFTLYFTIVSVPMAVGHVLKFWSYWLVYIALVQFTLRNPFQILGRDTGAYDAFAERTALVDRRGIVRQANRALRDARGDDGLIGQPCHALLHPATLPQAECPVCRAIGQATPAQAMELHYPDEDRWEEITLTPYFWSGRTVGMVHVARDVSERHRAAEALTQERDRARNYFNAADVMLVALDAAGCITSLNQKTAAVTGWREEELLGRSGLEVLAESERDPVRAQIASILEGRADREKLYENEILTRSGERRLIAWRGTPLLDAEGRMIGALVSGEDVTERRQDEAQLRQAAAVYENSSESVMICDANRRIVAINPAFTETTGFTEADVLGRPSYFLLPRGHDRKFLRAIWRQLRTEGNWQGELRKRRKAGDNIPVWEHVSSLRDADGRITHYIIAFTDITPLKASEERLAQLAHHDPLTGMPNRLLFHARVAHALERATRENTRLAVLFIDLDHFKEINDNYGHEAGDRLLVETAARLERCVRREDTVARMGGDEFTVLLEPLHKADDAARVAEKIIEALRQPFTLGRHQAVAGGSVGVSIFPEHGREMGTLLHCADLAMYRAKQQGRDSYQFYSEEMTVSAHERLALENSLRHAIAQSELRLHYQPQVHLESGKVVGVEALSRWRHPEKGLLPPANFIQVAEETGLIAALDEWVLRTACTQGRQWREQGLPLHMAVNVSGKALVDTGWIARMEAILTETGFDPAALELEISEAWLMTSAEQSVARLQQLKKLGVTITVDHFGTGISSLTYLKRFPLDKLKIDQSVLENALKNADDAAILRAIIALGHRLDLTVAAMGVSTAEQLAFLRHQGNDGEALGGRDEYQGFFWDHPLPADELAHRLRQAAPLPG